jgi:hypothetical protein
MKQQEFFTQFEKLCQQFLGDTCETLETLDRIVGIPAEIRREWKPEVSRLNQWKPEVSRLNQWKPEVSRIEPMVTGSVTS